MTYVEGDYYALLYDDRARTTLDSLDLLAPPPNRFACALGDIFHHVTKDTPNLLLCMDTFFYVYLPSISPEFISSLKLEVIDLTLKILQDPKTTEKCPKTEVFRRHLQASLEECEAMHNGLRTGLTTYSTKYPAILGARPSLFMKAHNIVQLAACMKLLVEQFGKLFAHQGPFDEAYTTIVTEGFIRHLEET